MQQRPSETQIVVSDLPPSVTEADLYQLASQYGQVAYIRVLRHIDTKTSLGVAFINFIDTAAVEKARNEMNGLAFKGRIIRAMKFNKERDPEANIFIKNIHESVTYKDLESHFKSFGNILSSKISFDENGNSKKYGFVQFEKKEAAQAAIANANGSTLKGSELQVAKFIPIGSRMISSNNNLYVRGFGADMTAERFHSVFSSFGEITSHVILSNRARDGTDRHFGFVCFANPENATKALETLNGKSEDGFTWYIAVHMNKKKRLAMLRQENAKKQEDWKRRNVYVRGLPLNIDEEKLRKLFAEFGEIESVRIPKVENIRYDNAEMIKEFTVKGVAYILFAQPQGATRAVQGMRDKSVEEKRLYVNLWRPREEIAKAINISKMKKMQSFMFDYGMMPGPMMMPGRGRQPAKAMPGRGWAGQQPMGRGKPQAFPPQAFPAQGFPPQQGFPVQVPIPAQQAAQPLVPLNFDIKTYEVAPPEFKKRMLGEALYPVVLKSSNTKIAGKITGMLLEMDNQELFLLLTNPEGLKLKVGEAIDVLRRAWENDAESLKLIEG
mmetsp:Transcript_18654/g.18634  ORF Transcript_18654/g.18634 Transcript_18654/m.18634 type:complete len:553 (+) Transcript_18654:6-1664(+)